MPDFCRECGRTLFDTSLLCDECMRIQDRNDEVREIQALAIKLCDRLIVIALIMICFTILVKWIEFSWFY